MVRGRVAAKFGRSPCQKSISEQILGRAMGQSARHPNLRNANTSDIKSIGVDSMFLFEPRESGFSWNWSDSESHSVLGEERVNGVGDDEGRAKTEPFLDA